MNDNAMARSVDKLNMVAGRERLAVVILNWNGEDFLRRFLSGVVEYSTQGSVAGRDNRPQGCDVRIVVADNASTDGSVEWLAMAYGEDDRVEVLQFDRNYGFTGGYNRALGHDSLAGYDYFLLLNSDVEVSEGWLVPLVAAMRSESGVAAVMPKIRDWTNRDRFEYAGASGGFIDVLGYPFCRGRILGTMEVDMGQYDSRRDIFWASGAAMLVRTEHWRELEGLDELFFAHMEEIDFCWRLHRKGYRVMVCPDSVVYHVGGGALPASSPRKTYLNFRNNIAMLYKNLARSCFAGLYPIRFGIDMAQALGYCLMGRFSFAAAVVRGHWDFWTVMRRSLNRHAEDGFVLQSHEIAAKSVLYRGSIVLRYLCGRRRFDNMI